MEEPRNERLGKREMNIQSLSQITDMTSEEFLDWTKQLGIDEGTPQYEQLKRIVDGLKEETLE